MKKILSVFFAFVLAACGVAAQEPPTPVPSSTPLPSSTPTPVLEELPVAETPLSFPQNQPQIPPVKGGNSTPNIGQPFWIPVGQAVELDVQGVNYAITFVEVTEDSRCPQGAQCIVAGNVGVKLLVAKGGANAIEVILTQGDVGETQATMQVEAIKLTLSKVAPLGAVGQPVDPALYQLEVLVEI